MSSHKNNQHSAYPLISHTSNSNHLYCRDEDDHLNHHNS